MRRLGLLWPARDEEEHVNEVDEVLDQLYQEELDLDREVYEAKVEERARIEKADEEADRILELERESHKYTFGGRYRHPSSGSECSSDIPSIDSEYLYLPVEWEVDVDGVHEDAEQEELDSLKHNYPEDHLEGLRQFRLHVLLRQADEEEKVAEQDKLISYLDMTVENPEKYVLEANREEEVVSQTTVDTLPKKQFAREEFAFEVNCTTEEFFGEDSDMSDFCYRVVY